MKTIAVITARGGSKRIPRKNIKDFCGKPIINYSIKAALENWDLWWGNGINGWWRDCSGCTYRRSKSAFYAFGGHIDWYGQHSGRIAGSFRCVWEKRTTFWLWARIYPTAPLATPDKLQDAMRLLLGGQRCTVDHSDDGILLSAAAWTFYQWDRRSREM